jgi:DNA topoisomerase III
VGKTLIIAEKPSQAREYAKTLGVKGKGEGYFENDEYIISWCIGHLLELNRPESYMDTAKVGTRWGVHRLPVLPRVGEFKHTLKSGTTKQYNVVTRLLRATEVEHVICGTDADREGQLLFQEVWDAVGCKKPLSRLWISSLTQEAILEGMAKLRPFKEVEGLALAGYGRSYADWDFGMNLTEGFTALFGSFDAVRKKPNVISIGRVQTPTLALVVEREWAIQNFVPVKYVEVEAEFVSAQGSYKGKWFDPESKASKEIEELVVQSSVLVQETVGEHEIDSEKTKKSSLDLKRAEEIIKKVKGQSGIVKSLKEKEVSEPHPLLFDLTSLTVTASKRFGYGAEKVLKIAQSLYEKKAITYPRSDCNFLPPDILPKLPGHLAALKQGPHAAWVQEAQAKPLPKGKRVINEITAHHAIIPTTEKITSDKLTTDEQTIYDLIVLRFLCVWFPPARYKETEVITLVKEESFQTKGKILLDLGWKKLEKHSKSRGESKEEKNTELLPPVQANETVQTRNCKAIQKETKPPKRFTQGELLKAMEGAGKEIDDEVLRQQLKGKGLGTVATRAATLENLLDRGYLIQEQKTLCPTEKGIGLIQLIKERLPQSCLLISAEMTGQMEFELSQVERGVLSLNQYMEKVEQAIRGIVEELRVFEKSFGKQPISLAPMKGKGPSVSKNRSLKKSEENEKIAGQQAVKNGDNTLKNDLVKSNSSDVAQSDNTPETLGTCPACGGSIIEGKKGYGCQSWRQGCKFVVWKTPICGKVLTKTQIKSLLKKGKTALIKGFRSKTGKTFSAYLIWENSVEGKIRFEFESNV